MTEQIDVAGRARGVPEWIQVSRANVSYDHPASAVFEHALLLDFVAPDPAGGVGRRIALELDVSSAHALMRSIQSALANPQAVADHKRAGVAG